MTQPHQVQSRDELEQFYADPDPWKYDDVDDDRQRVARVRAALPSRTFARTLDIGCGNGFLTEHLPGDELVGVDISERAVEHARARFRDHCPERRATFHARSLFELSSSAVGVFDLVVVTGVIYPQYVGRAYSLVTETLRDLLVPGGVMISVHIDDWTRYRPPFTLLTVSIDRYRDHFHRLEVLQR